MKASNLTKSLGLSAVATAAMVLLVELFCRAFLPQWAPPKAMRVNFWRFDDALGWKHEPLMEGRFEHQDFSALVSINSQGLRDKEYSLAKGAGKTRILLLGDSFAWGYGVGQEETIDSLIESKYDHIEFINAAVPGYGTDQEALYYKCCGRLFQSDLVVLLFHPNDAYNNASTNQYDYEKPAFQIAGGELVVKNHPVPNRWRDALHRLVINKTYFPRKVYLTYKAHAGPALPANGARRTALDVTKALLLELRKMTAGEGADFWVAGVPWRGGESLAITEAIQGFAENHQIRYLSLAEDFHAAAAETMFRHTQHKNSYGQSLAAQAIERELALSGYVGAKAPSTGPSR